MRIHAKRGDPEVTIDIDGSAPELLRQAEQAALQLLGEAPEKPAKPSFGYQGNTEENS